LEDQRKLVEHLSQKQVEDYSQQQLGAAELLSVSDHLGECEVCRVRVESGKNGEAAFVALHMEAFSPNGELSAHLTSEQAAEYVDKNLSGETLKMVTDHLVSCEQCAVAIEDLRAFRNEIAPSLEREYGPVAVPRKSESSWRQRFVSLFHLSAVPAFGGGALAVLLLAVTGWLIWRTPRTKEPEVVVVPARSAQPSSSSEPLSPPLQPASVVAQLNDGQRVLVLDQQGKLSGADDLPPAYQNLLKKTLSTQRIDRSSQLQGLTRPPSSLMSSDNQNGEFSVLEPVGRVLNTNQPAFRWSAMEGASGYVVEVYDEQFKLVASSAQLTILSWATTLSYGHVYSWQVKATKDGQEITSPRPPAPQAKFRVLDQGKVNELTRAKRAYGSSHLTLALLYADAGLLKEAEQELRLVRKENPNSDLARTLLRQIQTLRG
jgi:hypothetical protein